MSDIRKVKTNTFYKKQPITTGITIKPHFKDLAAAADNRTDTKTFPLSNGIDSSKFVLSGAVPTLPDYGGGEIQGGFLQLYANENTRADYRTYPSLYGYMLEKEVTLAEGNYNLATRSGSTASGATIVGNKLSVFNSKHSMTPYMYDSFENITTIGGISRLSANANISLSEPYITHNDLASIFHENGWWTNDYDFLRFTKGLQPGGASDVIPDNIMGLGVLAGRNSGGGLADTEYNDATAGYKLQFVNSYRDQRRSNNYQAFIEKLRLVKLENPALSNKYPGFWRSTGVYIGSLGKQKTGYYAGEYGGLEKYYRHLFDMRELDAKGRLSFLKLSSAASDVEANPEAGEANTIFSDIMKSDNRSNPYDGDTNNPLILSETTLSTEESLNGGQSMRFYHNWGYSSFNPIIQDMLGVSGNLNPQVIRASIYNIPCPPPAVDMGRATANLDTTTYNYGDMRSLVPEMRFPFKIKKMAPVQGINVSGAAGIKASGAKSFYWGTKHHAKTNFTDCENSFLRSIVVTFSNYKPKTQHTTVDKFLAYGLERFYEGETTENMVGGFVLSAFDRSYTEANGGTNPTTPQSAPGIWAFPLFVNPIHQSDTSPSPTNASYCLLSGGVMQLSGTSVGAGAENDMLDSLIWGVTPTWTMQSDEQPTIARLPTDSWVTARIFSDIYQHNNSGSSAKRVYAENWRKNKSTGDPLTSGVPMRVIFDTGDGNTDVVGSYAELGALANEEVENQPFVDIFFPYGHSFTDGSTTYTAGDKTVTCSSTDKIAVGQRVSAGSAVTDPETFVTSINNSAGAVTSFEITNDALVSVSTTTTFSTGPYSGATAIGEDWTFAEQPTWWPSVMTVWVQNYPWVADDLGLFKYGNEAIYNSGSSTEMEMFVDSIGLYNYGPGVDNLSASDGNSNFIIKGNQYYSPMASMISGQTAFGVGGYNKTGWVGSIPLTDVNGTGTTAKIQTVNGGNVVKLRTNDGSFGTGRLENAAQISGGSNVYAGTISITGTGIPAHTAITSETNIVINNSNQFKLIKSTNLTTNYSSASTLLTGANFTDFPTSGDAYMSLDDGTYDYFTYTGKIGTTVLSGISGLSSISGAGSGLSAPRIWTYVNATASGEVDATFNSSGTLTPQFSKANYNLYNTGFNLNIGFNERADLPITSSYSTNAGTYLLFNNFNCSDNEALKTNPVQPDKVGHLWGGARDTGGIGPLLSRATGSEQTDILGGQLHAPSYYLENDATYGTGSNISGAAFTLVSGGYYGSKTAGGGASSGDFSIDAYTYKLETNTNYKVQIDSTGTPDTFKWSDDGGSTWDAENVAIVAGAQSLNNNVEITWAATTGHGVGEYITFTALSPLLQGASNTSAAGLVNPTGSSCFVNTDGFRQKGFIYLGVSGMAWPASQFAGSTAYTGWEKRENIMCSTKITGIPNEGVLQDNQITVDDTTIFNVQDTECTYVIYLAGRDSTDAANRLTGLTLNSSTPIETNVVSFNEDVREFVGNSTTLPFLWVSPEKYWVTLPFDSPSTIAPRTYENICTIGQSPTVATCSGTTFNEFTFAYDATKQSEGGQQGLYTNIWDLHAGPESATVITATDFGLGDYDPETQTGGAFLKGNVRSNSYLHYSIDAAIGGGHVTSGDNFPLLLNYEGSNSEPSSSVFEEDDSTTVEKRPTLYYQYKDLPPLIDNFKVSPAIDVLKSNTNLYKLTTEDLNAVKFNWSENNADDIWYRMLMVESGVDISDKYHKAKLWLPLNEARTPTPAPGIGASDAYTWYNKNDNSSGSVTVTADSTVRAVIEGQGGYAAKLAASTGLTGSIVVPKGSNTGLTDEEEFTLVIHYTPSTDDEDSISYIAHQTTALGTATNNFELFKNAANKIVCKLGANIAMTGNTFITCNGDRPTSIIVTLNRNTLSPIKAKLYVNGVLDDSSTSSTYQTTSADFTLGGSGTSTYRGTSGLVEEVLIYTKAYEVVEEAGEYIYSTRDLSDSNTANTHNVVHSARLFAFDYHNLRGSNKRELGMSTITSWRATN
jgi:hypothetical protein